MMATADSKAAPRKFFSIYKSGQGKYVRFGTVGAMSLIVLTGAAWLVQGTPLVSISDWDLKGFSIPADGIKTGSGVIWIALGALITFWLVNTPSFSEFMIMTESEMRKVTWPSRAMVMNSTKIVIMLTFMLGALLWMVDVGFIKLFEVMHILKKP